MKFAVIGTGKTGGEVLKLIPQENLAGCFNSKNLPTLEKLKDADAVIVFTPPSAVADLIPLLIEARKPVAFGTTGFTWPSNLDNELKIKNISWLVASNFSLSMNLVFYLSRILSRVSDHLDEAEFQIKEVHHIHKKDKPSGTALTLQKVLNKPVSISALRENDVKGFHELSLSTPLERVVVSHEALDRSIFAKGAIWATTRLADGALPAGLHYLENVVEKLSPEVFHA